MWYEIGRALMKVLVVATIFVMLQNGMGHQQTIKIDPRACAHPTYQAEVEGQPATVGIRCHK